MDAEIQFFMTKQDEQEFLEFAEKQIDHMEQDASIKRLIIGDCELLFTPSVKEENTLYTGKLEIRLGNTAINYNDLERAKSSFRKLRNSIKKKYWSRLAYKDKNKKDRLTPSRVHWLGPNAKQWKDENPEQHQLKLSKTSWMTFEIGF